MNSRGALGFLYQEFTGTEWVTRLEVTSDAWATTAETHDLHRAPWAPRPGASSPTSGTTPAAVGGPELLRHLLRQQRPRPGQLPERDLLPAQRRLGGRAAAQHRRSVDGAAVDRPVRLHLAGRPHLPDISRRPPPIVPRTITPRGGIVPIEPRGSTRAAPIIRGSDRSGPRADRPGAGAGTPDGPRSVSRPGVERVLLVSMPFGALERPPLSLGLLKAHCGRLGVACESGTSPSGSPTSPAWRTTCGPAPTTCPTRPSPGTGCSPRRSRSATRGGRGVRRRGAARTWQHATRRVERLLRIRSGSSRSSCLPGGDRRGATTRSSGSPRCSSRTSRRWRSPAG